MLHNYVNGIKNSSQIYFHNAKMSSASGGLTPWPGALPLTPLGAKSPDPIYTLALPRSPWSPKSPFPPLIHPTNRALHSMASSCTHALSYREEQGFDTNISTFTILFVCLINKQTRDDVNMTNFSANFYELYLWGKVRELHELYSGYEQTEQVWWKTRGGTQSE